MNTLSDRGTSSLQAGPGRMSSLDWLLSGLLCLFLVTLCILRSRTRLLWADETYVHRMVTSPSMWSMLRGWYHGMDGGGGLYYVLVRLWSQVFGTSEISLRLFSTAGMCVALLASWAAGRRYFSTLAVALAIGVVYLTAPPMLWQEVNARFYGLFLAFAVVAGLLFLRTAEVEVPRRTDLLLLAAAHAGLIGSHILGIVYSFVLIAGSVALDLYLGRFRPRLYAAALAGWSTLFLTFHAVRASAAVAANHFWTRTPGLADLLTGVALEARLPAMLLLLVALTATMLAWLRPSSRLQVAGLAAPVALCLALWTAQLILFAKSQIGTSLYVDRYLLPLSLPLALVLAAGFTVLLPRGVLQGSSALRGATALLCWVPMLHFALSHNIFASTYPPLHYVEQVTAVLPANQPVVATLPAYTLFSSYDPKHTYLFMLDWPYDLQPSRAAVDLSGQHLMQNWKDGGFDADRILPCPALFSAHPDVTLLLDFFREDWFHDRIEHNPAFRVERMQTFTGWWAPITVYNIHRVGPGSLPC